VIYKVAKPPDLPITDFSGGLVTNKSDFRMQQNELKNSLNMEIDEEGKLKRRRGIQLYGDTHPSGGVKIIDDSFLFLRQTLGSTPTAFHIAIQRANSPNVYRLVSTYSTAAITTATTTIASGTNSAFTASGVIEMDGDEITYTSLPTSTSFAVTASTILTGHPAFTYINHWVNDGTITIDGRSGIYFSVLNNLLFINGRAGSFTFDGSSYTAVSDDDEPGGIFATNYRDRIYVAGSGIADGAGNRNSSSIRVSFSDAGDSRSWDINNFFDVEDNRGESITGFREINDTLLIFKVNSMFGYDEVQLKQRLWNIGAYNHKVIQRIGEQIFTFCPSGVWVTNGTSAQKISDPIRKYIDHFRPQYDTLVGRVVDNCFAGVFESKYYLYIHDIEEPESLDDVVLVYDTLTGKWTVHDEYTNLTHFASLSGFSQGPSADATDGDAVTQHTEALFAGDGLGHYYRLFDNRFLDNESTRTYRGGDIFPNMITNDAGSGIQTIAETKFIDLAAPGQWGYVRALTILVEQGQFQISYRLDLGNKITDPISLGFFQATNTEVDLKGPNDQGYRISFRITGNSRDNTDIFNGIILQDRSSQEGGKKLRNAT